MAFQIPSVIKVGGKTAKSVLSPALLLNGDKFLTAYVGEGGSKLYSAWAAVSAGAVEWFGNEQVITVGKKRLETHRAPGLYLNLTARTPGIVYVSPDRTSIDQTVSPFQSTTWSDPQPLADFNAQRVKWAEIFVSTCGFQSFVVAVDVDGGVWFSAQTTWFDAFSGGASTTSWTNAQKIEIGNIQSSPGEFVSNFDCWGTAVCTVINNETGSSAPFTALYGFCPKGIAVFKIGIERIDETNNVLTIGNWSFLKFIPIKVLSATACTLGTGQASNHPLFFIDTSPGGLLTADVSPGLPSFFQTPVTALKPGDKFSTDAVPGVTYFSVGQSGPFGLALIWKQSGGHDLVFSSELL